MNNTDVVVKYAPIFFYFLFFLTEMQKSVAYIYFFIFNLNWMFALYLLILQGCIASTRCHLVHWSINIVEVCKQNFTGIGKNPDFWPLDLIFGFCWWWSFSGLIRLWTGQHLSLQRHFFFTKVKAFTRTKAFLESLQESIRGTATTAGLNHKTADVNTRVFSYALSVNSAWTSESVDVNLKEKGKKCT